jgi:hypothetical protein
MEELLEFRNGERNRDVGAIDVGDDHPQAQQQDDGPAL